MVSSFSYGDRNILKRGKTGLAVRGIAVNDPIQVFSLPEVAYLKDIQPFLMRANGIFIMHCRLV